MTVIFWQRGPSGSLWRPARVVLGVGAAVMFAAVTAPVTAAAAAGVDWVPGAPAAVPGVVDTAITADLGANGSGFVSSGLDGRRLVAPLDVAGNVGRGVRIPAMYYMSSGVGRDGRSLLVGRLSGGVVWARLDSRAHVGKAHRVAGAVTRDDPRVLMNAAGDALILWSQVRGGKKAVRFVVRTASGKVSRAAWVNDPAGWEGFTGAAIGPGGRLAFTSISARRTRGQRVYATTGTRTHLRGPVRIGRAPYTSDVYAAIDGRGRTFLAWRSQNINEDLGPTEPNGPWQLQVGSIPRGSARADPAQTLDRSTSADVGTGYPTLVANMSGGAIVGFTRAESTAAAAAIVVAPKSGRFGKLVTLGDGTYFSGAAANDAGTTVVTWRTKTQVMASRIIGQAIGDAEDTHLASMPNVVGFLEDGKPLVLGFPSGTEPRAQVLRSVRTEP